MGEKCCGHDHSKDLKAFEKTPHNPTTFRLKLGHKFLQKLDHVIVDRTTDPKILEAFPFAKLVLNNLKHVDNVLLADLGKSEEAREFPEDYIAIQKKGPQWKEDEELWVLKMLVRFIENLCESGIDNNKFCVEDALIARGYKNSNFNPKTLNEQRIHAFMIQSLLPRARSHGGAIELLRVYEEKKGREVSAEIELKGGCSGCGNSVKMTINVAQNALREAFNAHGVKFTGFIVNDPSNTETPRRDLRNKTWEQILKHK